MQAPSFFCFFKKQIPLIGPSLFPGHFGEKPFRDFCFVDNGLVDVCRPTTGGAPPPAPAKA